MHVGATALFWREVSRVGIKVMHIDTKIVILIQKGKLISHADGSDLRSARILLGLQLEQPG